jgi:hypothetical protein
MATAGEGPARGDLRALEREEEAVFRACLLHGRATTSSISRPSVTIHHVTTIADFTYAGSTVTPSPGPEGTVRTP